MIFSDGPHGPVRGQVPLDRGPGAAGVRTLEQIRLEVGVLVVLKRDIDRVWVVVRSDDAADVREFRNVAYLIDFTPVPAPVFGDLNQTVVRADVNQSLFLL